MAKSKNRTKTFHGLPKWKMALILSVSLLRLRFSPSIPFSKIAELLQMNWPEYISRFAAKQLPCIQEEEKKEEDGSWLPAALESMFKESERRQTWLWQAARDLEEWAVWQFGVAVGVFGDWSESNGCMYGVSSREEVRLQIRWRTEGDWRAGSVPLLDSEINGQGNREVGIIGEKRERGEV